MSLRKLEIPGKTDYIVLAADDDRLVRHDTHSDAGREADRLAHANPGKSFKVFCQADKHFITPALPKPLAWAESAAAYAGKWADFVGFYPKNSLVPAFPRYFVAKTGACSWRTVTYVRFDSATSATMIRPDGNTGGPPCGDLVFAVLNWEEVTRAVAEAMVTTYPRFFTEPYLGKWDETAYVKFEHKDERGLCFLKNGTTGRRTEWDIASAAGSWKEVSQADAVARVKKPYPRYFTCIKEDGDSATFETTPLLCFVTSTQMKHLRRSPKGVGPRYEWGTLSGIGSADVERVNPRVFGEITANEAGEIEARLTKPAYPRYFVREKESGLCGPSCNPVIVQVSATEWQWLHYGEARTRGSFRWWQSRLAPTATGSVVGTFREVTLNEAWLYAAKFDASYNLPSFTRFE